MREEMLRIRNKATGAELNFSKSQSLLLETWNIKVNIMDIPSRQSNKITPN
jgi:hypothetical protein